MVTERPCHFRLVCSPAVSVEFAASAATTLMTAALEARQRLVQHSWAQLQVWSDVAQAWCDPRYQNEPRRFEVRPYAIPYLNLWRDVWQWCEDALLFACPGRPTAAR